MALSATEPLRGLLDQDDEYALDSATTEALSARILASLPLFKSSRSSEVVAVLQNIKMWATAAEGWLRVPVEGYALLRSLILCLRHKEKAVHLPTIEVLQDVSSTRLGVTMLLHPSKFDSRPEVQCAATEYDRVEVQALLESINTLMQQTTGVPNGRTVVYGLIKIVENLVQVPGTFELLDQMPDFYSLFSRLLNLHGQTLNDLQITVTAGRLIKCIFKHLRHRVLENQRYALILMDLTKEIRRGVCAVAPDGGKNEDKALIRKKRMGVAAAIQAAEEAKEDLVEKMAKVEEYRQFVAQFEESNYVDERRMSMHYRELIADALREAEEAASILLIKEKKAEKMVSGENKVDNDKVQAAIASADDAAELLAILTDDHQGRMQVLTLHPNVRMLFAGLSDALSEGICPASKKVLEALTHPSDCAHWLIKPGGLSFEQDDRSRLVKLDLIPPIASMLASEETLAQSTSLRVLMNLFRTSCYMEPLHPQGELCRVHVLPKLRDCLFSENSELSMYAARMINRLTGLKKDGAPQRMVMVGGEEAVAGGNAEAFLEMLAVLLLNADTDYDLANVMVTLAIFLCNEEVSECLTRVLHPCDEGLYNIPELTTFQKLLGYTQAKPPSSESGAPSDNEKLPGLLRRALCKALQSDVPSATAAAAESVLVLVQNAQWRLWLMSGRGATSPTKLLTMLMSKAEALPAKVKQQEPQPEPVAAAERVVEANAPLPVAPNSASVTSWIGSFFGGYTPPAASPPAPPTAPSPAPPPALPPPPPSKVATVLQVEGSDLDAHSVDTAESNHESEPVTTSEEVHISNLNDSDESTKPAQDDEVVVVGASFGNLCMTETEPKSNLPSGVLQAMARMNEQKTSDKKELVVVPPPPAPPSSTDLAALGPSPASDSSRVTRADMLKSWVGSVEPAAAPQVMPYFGEAPEELPEELALPVVWTGVLWMQIGAAGVIAKIFLELTKDPQVIKRLSLQDQKAQVAQVLMYGLCGLMHSKQGAKIAAEAVKIFTTKAHGLMYLSCLGPKGINQLIRILSETALTAPKPDVQQIAKDAAACLEAAKPPRA